MWRGQLVGRGWVGKTEAWGRDRGRVGEGEEKRGNQEKEEGENER